MKRTTRFEVPFETRHFTPFQLQTKALCEIANSGWSRWLKAHMIPFPQLIKQHRVSFVIAGLKLNYLHPLTFFDADSLEATFAPTVRAGGKMIVWDIDFAANDHQVAQARFATIPVLIRDEMLSALPGLLPDTVYQQFTPEECLPDRPKRYVGELVQSIEENGRYLTSGTHPIFLHRHVCEVADQWSYTELTSHAAGSREMLALQQGQAFPDLIHGLSQPLRQVDAELARPYYAFDDGSVESKAYCYEGRLTLVHRLFCDVGPGLPHAVVVEQF